MNIRKDKLRPIKTPLMGFRGENVISKRIIQLPVLIGEAPDQVTSMLDFLVVDYPFICNMIVGRHFLNSIKADTSTYALVIKF